MADYLALKSNGVISLAANHAQALIDIARYKTQSFAVKSRFNAQTRVYDALQTIPATDDTIKQVWDKHGLVTIKEFYQYQCVYSDGRKQTI